MFLPSDDDDDDDDDRGDNEEVVEHYGKYHRDANIRQTRGSNDCWFHVLLHYLFAMKEFVDEMRKCPSFTGESFRARNFDFLFNKRDIASRINKRNNNSIWGSSSFFAAPSIPTQSDGNDNLDSIVVTEINSLLENLKLFSITSAKIEDRKSLKTLSGKIRSSIGVLFNIQNNSQHDAENTGNYIMNMYVPEKNNSTTGFSVSLRPMELKDRDQNGGGNRNILRSITHILEVFDSTGKYNDLEMVNDEYILENFHKIRGPLCYMALFIIDAYIEKRLLYHERYLLEVDDKDKINEIKNDILVSNSEKNPDQNAVWIIMRLLFMKQIGNEFSQSDDHMLSSILTSIHGYCTNYRSHEYYTELRLSSTIHFNNLNTNLQELLTQFSSWTNNDARFTRLNESILREFFPIRERSRDVRFDSHNKYLIVRLERGNRAEEMYTIRFDENVTVGNNKFTFLGCTIKSGAEDYGHYTYLKRVFNRDLSATPPVSKYFLYDDLSKNEHEVGDISSVRDIFLHAILLIYEREDIHEGGVIFTENSDEKMPFSPLPAVNGSRNVSGSGSGNGSGNVSGSGSDNSYLPIAAGLAIASAIAIPGMAMMTRGGGRRRRSKKKNSGRRKRIRSRNTTIGRTRRRMKKTSKRRRRRVGERSKNGKLRHYSS